MGHGFLMPHCPTAILDLFLSQDKMRKKEKMQMAAGEVDTVEKN